MKSQPKWFLPSSSAAEKIAMAMVPMKTETWVVTQARCHRPAPARVGEDVAMERGNEEALNEGAMSVNRRSVGEHDAGCWKVDVWRGG